MVVWKTVLDTNAGAFLWNDAARYDAAAHVALHLEQFEAWPNILGNEFGKVPPGYPAFWAGLHLLFDNRDEIVVLANIFGSLIIIALSYSIAKRLFGAETALLTALLFSIDIASFAYSVQAMSETPFTFFLLIMILAGVRFFTGKGNGKWVCSLGTALAGATLVRSVSYYLILPILVILLAWTLPRQSLKNISANLGLALIPFLFSVGAVQFYTYTQFGSWAYTTIGGFNMYYYRAAAIVALRNNVPLDDVRNQFTDELNRYRQEHPIVSNWNVFQVSDWMMAQGMAIVRQCPVELVRTEFNGIIPMMLGGGDGPLLRMLNIPVVTVEDHETFDALKNFQFAVFFKRFASSTSLVSFIFAIFYLSLIYSGALFWMVGVIRTRRTAIVHLFLWVVILYFIIVSAGPEANSRFRVPITPVLAIYAAAGWRSIYVVTVTKLRKPSV
jgi:4-amino-4-deoxy-L-arabinose transferase-like glycosyltransferase